MMPIQNRPTGGRRTCPECGRFSSLPSVLTPHGAARLCENKDCGVVFLPPDVEKHLNDAQMKSVADAVALRFGGKVFRDKPKSGKRHIVTAEERAEMAYQLAEMQLTLLEADEEERQKKSAIATWDEAEAVLAASINRDQRQVLTDIEVALAKDAAKAAAAKARDLAEIELMQKAVRQEPQQRRDRALIREFEKAARPTRRRDQMTEAFGNGWRPPTKESE